MTGTIQLTIDPTPHSTKPQGIEIAAITNRLKAAGSSIVSVDDLAGVIRQGGTFVCGCYTPSQKGWGEFVGMQVFALDFDKPDRLEPHAALERCEMLHIEPTLIYFTFTATVEPWVPKYRLVFVSEEVITEEATAEWFLLDLLRTFPEADQSCKNLSRLFFGTRPDCDVIDCSAGRW